MELRYRTLSHGMFLLSLLGCVAFLTVGSLRVQSDSQFVSKQGPQPPSSSPGHLFPCLQSLDETNRKIRVAVLHGPDWVLESSINLSCFPERDVVFASEVGKGLISRPFTARTRLWITRDHGLMQIRIVESSGSVQRDMVAMSFATNHKCIDRSSKNCIVEGIVVPPRID
jgi:hypothetical protein